MLSLLIKNMLYTSWIALLLAPSTLSDEVSTSAPVAAPYVCLLCDEGVEFSNPDDMVDLGEESGLGNQTCGTIMLYGELGIVSEQECAEYAPLLDGYCFCTTEAPSSVPTLTPPCDFCEISNPNTYIGFVNETDGVDFTCQDIKTLGASGNATDEQCNEYSPAFDAACNCIDNAPCYFCGSYEIPFTNPEAIANIPLVGEYTCAELDQMGKEGQLTVDQCPSWSAYAAQSCDCADPPTSAPTPAPYMCYFCATPETEFENPDDLVDVPDLGPTSCETIRLLAQDPDFANEEDCELYSPLVLAECNCVVVPVEGPTMAPVLPEPSCYLCGDPDTEFSNPDDLVDIPDVGEQTCEEAREIAAVPGFLSPDECAEYTPLITAYCFCVVEGPTMAPAPIERCYFCDRDDFFFTNPDDTAIIPGLPETTCGEIETLGADGLVDSATCAEAAPYVLNACQCNEELDSEDEDEEWNTWVLVLIGLAVLTVAATIAAYFA